MRRKVTTWRPDTCGCTIHYEWDFDLPVEERVHTPVEHVTTYDGRFVPHSKCERHAHLPDHVSHYNAVLAENQKKNAAFNLLAELLFGPAPTGSKDMTIRGRAANNSGTDMTTSEWVGFALEAVRFSYDSKNRLTFRVRAPAYTAEELTRHLASHGHSDVGVTIDGS